MDNKPENSLGMKCIKILLILINIFFIFTALLIISISSAIFGIYTNFDTFLEDAYFSPSIIFIVIGFLILFVSMIGSIGAIKESTAVMSLFTVLMTIVLIAEVVGIILTFTSREGVYNAVRYNLKDAINNYEKEDDIKLAVDYMQSTLKCCGCDNYNDWNGHLLANNNLGAPISCCANYSNYRCEIYTSGCLQRIELLVHESALLLATGAMIIIFIQFMGMLLSITLARSIRQAKTNREMKKMDIRKAIIANNVGYSQLLRGDSASPTVYIASSSDV